MVFIKELSESARNKLIKLFQDQLQVFEKTYEHGLLRLRNGQKIIYRNLRKEFNEELKRIEREYKSIIDDLESRVIKKELELQKQIDREMMLNEELETCIETGRQKYGELCEIVGRYSAKVKIENKERGDVMDAAHDGLDIKRQIDNIGKSVNLRVLST